MNADTPKLFQPTRIGDIAIADSASAAATMTTMPMPQLKVRRISASDTLPACCSQWNTGGSGQLCGSMATAVPC